MSSMLQWALYYREQGLSVIPVSGKVPLIQWRKYQEEKASEEEIKTWWRQWPEADIGMVTGRISNRFVVDVDGAEGQASYIQFLASNSTGLSSNLQRVRTKRGFQIHFKYPTEFAGKTTLAGVLPGVDTRGEGGYAKLPPSMFSDASGRYSWDEQTSEIQDCPASILGLLEEYNKPREISRESGESWLKEKLDGLKQGTRNSSFTAVAGSLRSRGYSSADIQLLLTPYAASCDFEISELKAICDSVGQYQPKEKTVNTEAQSVSDFLADEQKVEWIVPGLIAKRSISFIHGMPMTSKSWIAFDLAIEMAKGGGLWLGKFPVNGGKVLLVEAERFKGETQRRLKALICSSNNPEDAQLKLHVKTGSTTRLNLPQSFDAFRNLLAEHKPDLIIWDSFATAHTAGEKDRMEIQKVLEAIKSLREEFGCAFFFVNHDTKNSLQHQPGESKQPSMSDMQGNIAVAAVAEMMLSVKRKDEDTCMVYNVKNTLASAIQPFSVTVTDVENGIVVKGS